MADDALDGAGGPTTGDGGPTTGDGGPGADPTAAPDGGTGADPTAAPDGRPGADPTAAPDGGPGEPSPPAHGETPGERSPIGMRGTEVAIAIGFTAAIAGAIGLAVCYGLGGQPQVEGVLLFVTLGGIGFGIAAWGKYLMPNGPFVQAREPMASTAEERGSAAESIERGTE